MKAEHKYYKGTLRCQFETKDQKNLGASNFKQSKFKLQPRYKMEEVELIEVEEYPNIQMLADVPYLRSQEQCDVEMSFKRISLENNVDSRLVKVSEFFLILDSSNAEFEALNQETEGGKYPLSTYLKENGDVDVYYSSFNAMKDNSQHGKIKGFAYCKETIYYDDDNKVISTDILLEQKKLIKIKEFSATNLGKLSNAAGCFPVFFGKRMSLLSGMNIGPNPNAGCFGGTDLLNTGGGGTGSWRGCFGSLSRRGCFSMGCLYPILLLFIAALSFWLFQQSCNPHNDSVRIVHDTVQVEVIKDRIDTLTIVKSDTLSIIDSTTRVNYETIRLPNVQFYSNSDTLLPSSALELQKLTEYLIKNDSLSATIYGHTDNVGNPASNLQLSQRRAESVKRFLTSLGVAPTRLTAVGVGDKEPRGDNNSTEGRLMNRRVEVKLMQKEVITKSRINKSTSIRKDSTGLKAD